MAVTKRGKVWYLRIRPFDKSLINLRTMAQSKSEAMKTERAILTACGAGDYRSLDPVSREACARMFTNQGLAIPRDLAGESLQKEELTLWRAIELFLKYPDVKNSPNRERHEQALLHIVEKWGRDFPVKSIWIPEIKA